MGLTQKQWEGLREPFPPESIGKLPKPYRSDSQKGQCRECGGYHGLPAVHLDYVGHAVITNRLNLVDPDWNWAPMAFDDHGAPALDGEKNLWIWLTIGGKTIPAVGDGKNMKERIGDAIRNGAMRFGVALELWAKEELEDWAIERGEREPQAPQTPDDIASATPAAPEPRKRSTRAKKAAETPPEPAATNDPPATVEERAVVTKEAQFYGFGKDDRAAVMAVLSRVTGREISGLADLTSSEAKRCAENFQLVADKLAEEAISQGLGGVAE